MADLESKAKSPRKAVLSGDILQLATRALSVIAEKQQPSRLADRIAWLSDQVLSGDPEDGKAAIQSVLDDGVSVDDTIDYVLPAIARLLGDRWFADDISFVDVSIGTARLQETVRLLRSRERERNSSPTRNGRVLLIVPAVEEHTLGVVVAADQLRRRGLSVDLSVAERRQEIATKVRNGQYRMIGITASGIRTVASVKELVDSIRRNAPKFTPIALGGPLAEDPERLGDRVDVDIITSDVCNAAERCGLLPAKQY